MNIKEGDVFITKLKRNFFGAFKVLKSGKSFFEDSDNGLLMIGVLNYIDTEKPLINDKNIEQILCCNRFSMSDNYCINFFTDNPKYNNIKEYEFLGNLPLTDFERKLEFKLGSGRDGLDGGFPLSGVIESHIGNNAFYEWRWKNEKEEFIKEAEQDKIEFQKRIEAHRRRQMKPKKMLNENSFWEIIELIDWAKEEDEERTKPAIDFLSKKKVSEIKQFQENLSYKLYQLDTKEHAKNIGEESYKNEETHFSTDYFLYIRCCVIANGKEVFQNTLNSPKLIPKDLNFEPLLYLAEQAYEKRMNKELEYDTGCDYETFSNVKGWE
jgi:hypothetical protein